jgi:hypothetical protein
MIISRGKQRTSDFKMLQDFKRPHESSKDFMRLHDTSHYVKRLLKTFKDFWTSNLKSPLFPPRIIYNTRIKSSAKQHSSKRIIFDNFFLLNVL